MSDWSGVRSSVSQQKSAKSKRQERLVTVDPSEEVNSVVGHSLVSVSQMLLGPSFSTRVACSMGTGGLNSILGAHGESRTLMNISNDESASAVTCCVIRSGGMTEERKMVGAPLHLRT